jgi:nucleoside-diphosphate-sugar epimerase
MATFALRYFNVFGPYQNPDSQYAAVVPKFISSCKAGTSPVIHGDGGQTRDFTFVDNVIAANLACCRCPPDGRGAAYNIAGGQRISVNELYAKIAGLTGYTGQPVYVESRPGDVRDSLADVTAARRNLGWAPSVSLDEGLAKTVKYYSSL